LKSSNQKEKSTPSKIVINQDKTLNSLKVGKEIELGSSSKGSGNRFEILVEGGFPFTYKRKNKGGLIQVDIGGHPPIPTSSS
jgi:hypothetical protein